MNREIELTRKEYSDRQMIDSEEFNNVAYEVREGAVNIMLWNEHGRKMCLPGRIDEIERFAYELLDICEAWRDVEA